MRHAVRHLKSNDPVLAAIIERIGPFRMTYREPCFATMARSITFQQLNGKAASTIFNRLLEAAGGELTPASLLALRDEQMRAVGMSRQKSSYLRDLATRTAAGEIEFERLPDMTDDDVIEHLTRVRGVGVWSAQMFLMFALKRPDVMPTADLGINVAIQRAYRKRKLPKPHHVLKISQPWRPFRSVACWYLWRFAELRNAA